jgi:drug/metabolite transporter (DMT)-like permease
VTIDRALPAVLVTITFWALNVTIVKWTVGQWQPLAYSVDRFIIGTAVFAAYVYWREGSLRVERRDLPLFAIAAAVGIACNQAGFMYAERYTQATTISLLMATTPAFAAVTAWGMGHERVGWRHWTGMAIAVLGTVLVLRGGGAHLDLTSLRGDLLALLMAGSWGVYSALIRPLMARYSASQISVVVLVMGTLFLLPFSLGQVVHQDYGSLSTGAWAALVYSLFFSLVFTNILWFGAIHRGGASRATAVLPLQPFLGALFAVILLGEHLGPLQVVGGAVIIAGIAFTRRRVPVPTAD